MPSTSDQLPENNLDLPPMTVTDAMVKAQNAEFTERLTQVGQLIDERMAEIKALNKYIMRLETALMFASASLRQPTPEVGSALHTIDYALKMKDHQ